MSDATQTKDQTEEQQQQGGDEGETSERFGGEGGTKWLAIGYAGMIALVILALGLLLKLGSGMQAPPTQTGGGAAGARTTVSADKIMWKLLLAGIVIIAACRLVGNLLKKLHQPHVIGEIIAGILLGPSLFGKVWPQGFEFVFPVELMSYLDLLAQLGLIFYMFLVGLELNFDLMRGKGHAAIWVSHASIIAPFLMGTALALWLYPTLGSGGRFTAFGLFIGAAMAITAFPVLARILTDRGLYKTQLGTVALTVGAVDDITAWCMLAIIITIARSTGVTSALKTVGIALAFTLATIYFVRPVMLRVSAYYERRGKMSGNFLAMLFICIVLWAFVTDKLGIHVIFGAFLFGAIMPHGGKFVEELTEKLEDFSVVFLLPFFFTFSGIRTDVFALGRSPKLWLMTLAILAVAIAGKWGGSKLAARFAGLSWRESGALGVLVNCRGLTELIILNIGLQLKVLPMSAFAMLVIMAVVTTLMTEPALAIYYPRRVQQKMIEAADEEEEEQVVEEAVEDTGDSAETGDEAEGEAGRREETPERWHILVAVGNPEMAEELAHVSTLLAGDREEGDAEVTLLRVVDVSGTEVSHAPSVQDEALDEAVDRLRPLVEIVEDAGYAADPIAVADDDVGEAIARVANDRGVDLVLLGYHEAIFGDRLLGGNVAEVLRRAEADVAVLVDPKGPRELRLGQETRILIPCGGGFHEEAGLEIARRLGQASGGELDLLGPADEEEQLQEKASEASEKSGAQAQVITVQGDLSDELLEQAGDFDLLVLGVSDRWVTQQELLAHVREEVMQRSQTPYLIVRRHGGARGTLLRWWGNLKQFPRLVVDVFRNPEGGQQAALEEAEEQTRERLEGEEQTREGLEPGERDRRDGLEPGERDRSDGEREPAQVSSASGSEDARRGARDIRDLVDLLDLRRIVLPVAGRQEDRYAAEVAFSLARDRDITVDLVHVVPRHPTDVRGGDRRGGERGRDDGARESDPMVRPEAGRRPPGPSPLPDLTEVEGPSEHRVFYTMKAQGLERIAEEVGTSGEASVSRPGGGTGDQREGDGQQFVSQLAELGRSLGARVETEVLFSDAPEDTLVEYVQDSADLVVLARPREGTPATPPTTADEQLVRQVRCPVVVVNVD